MLARQLAETLPRDAAPLVAEVRALVAVQPRQQLAEQYTIQPDAAPAIDAAVSPTLRQRHGSCATSLPDGMGGTPAATEVTEAADSTLPVSGQQATAGCSTESDGSRISEPRQPYCTPYPPSEIEPHIQPASPAGPDAHAAAIRDPATEALLPDSLPPVIRWPQPDAVAQQLQRAAASDDECAKPARWQPDAGFFLRHGAPRQSRATLRFANWRLEQLFQPWRAAACSQAVLSLSSQLCKYIHPKRQQCLLLLIVALRCV